MANQGLYLKFGKFAGKTTSLDTKLQDKKKIEAAQDDRNLQTMNTYVQKIFNNTGHRNAPTREEKEIDSYIT